MLDLALRSGWVHDLPVCFPGRACMWETPAAGHVVNLTSALLPASPGIAAGCFVAIGIALTLIVLALEQQRRGLGVRPWFAIVVTALLLIGVVTAWTVGGRLGAIAVVYGGADGRPSAPPPASLIGSWPLVLAAGRVMMALAAIAIFLAVNTAAIRERRAHRLRESAPTRSGL